MNLILISYLESIYLLYMYFIYKTNYSFNHAIFDKEVNSMGSFFIHNSSFYENKICTFGKYMAIIAVSLIILRAYYIENCNNYKKIIINTTITFDIVCIILASLMNLNALVYIIPVIFSEIYILQNIN